MEQQAAVRRKPMFVRGEIEIVPMVAGEWIVYLSLVLAIGGVVFFGSSSICDGLSRCAADFV